ncbi:box C/D snoRNA protein 1-like [Ylistrum balloti]|uniref:box C/D snoRNA protein 1-like n=1 Tax=Ylistrum balloti TaxID=509963 RepID=UPI002905C530|nr:box C/D snoRNA protein 1-like [Ylistrum balloti]
MFVRCVVASGNLFSPGSLLIVNTFVYYRKCEICSANIAKYKCPGCMAQTCSLPCVKRHKADKGCNGQRKKTEFVAIKEYSDRNLLNDYRFLEETNRKVDSTQRDPLKQRSNKPNFLVTLVKEARKRGIKLKIMPYPMARRKHNLTMYHHKLKTILWNVQWLFPQSEAKYTSKRLSEHLSMEELLKDFVHPTESDPIKQHALKAYCQKGLHNCRLFMKVEERPANDVMFYELCLEKTLQKNLVGKCIVEYPIIHVVLKDHCDSYSVLNTVSDSDSSSSSSGSEDEVVSSPLQDQSQVGDKLNVLADSDVIAESNVLCEETKTPFNLSTESNVMCNETTKTVIDDKLCVEDTTNVTVDKTSVHQIC